MDPHQQRLTEFLDQHIAWPRATGYSHWAESAPWTWQVRYQRPTAEDLARELLTTAEFRALRLGTWLGTTRGEIIVGAVEMVLPPFYRQDAELLVEALKLAAQMQQAEGQLKAGQVALAAGLGALAVGAIIGLSRAA